MDKRSILQSTPELEVVLTKDGSTTVLHKQFGAHYHSVTGAVSESQHVFINAGLKYVAAKTKQIALLEVGFGAGLNAYLTLVESKRLGLTIHYVAIEPFPLDPVYIDKLNFADVAHRDAFLKMHLQTPEQQQLADNFLFERHKLTIAEFGTFQKFDLVYYDAFAPGVQPEMWTTAVFTKLFEQMNVGGVLVTYCAKGAVKRTLSAAGFIVETLEGAPGKREMIRATKPV